VTSSVARDPDRLFPVDPSTRSIARELHAGVAQAPIVSPHGHVPVEMIEANQPFQDPAALLVIKDHYVTRLLHAAGVRFEDLGQNPDHPGDPRAIWRSLCDHWRIFAGTASGYWLSETLSTVFGLHDELTSGTADATFDQIETVLSQPRMRPRTIFDDFGIAILATTDDVLDDLSAHRALADDPTFAPRVLPTFRPDNYLDTEGPAFADRVGALLAHTGEPTTFAGYLRALEARRAHFIDHGATSADHGVVSPYTVDLDAHAAQDLFDAALAGDLDTAGTHAFCGHMLMQMARMSVADGLVMTVHPGVRRNHHTGTFRAFGADKGHDIPLGTGYTDNLRPLLELYGLEPGFHLVLFTVDETTFSREIAPLAGFYPSVYAGAPWWFLDAPDAMNRFRSAVTETAGFYRTSGFIDDTRAFLSIPARHDTSRRVDAGFLARLVAEGRISLDTATAVMGDLVDAIPRQVFKL